MKYLLYCLIWMAPLGALAQDPVYYAKPDSLVPTFRVILKIGTKLTGRILYQDEKICRVLTEKGMELEIISSDIARIERIEFDPGRFSNAFPHRLIGYPTALPMKKGSTEYSTIYVVASRFGYGLTKRLSVGGSFYTFDPFRAFGFHAKWLIFSKDQFHLALDGNLYSGDRARGATVLPQVIMTIGTGDNNVTLGGGALVDPRHVMDLNGVFVLGGTTKISRGTSLVTQNQLLTTRQGSAAGILAVGIRMNSKRAGFDAGLTMITGNGDEFDRPRGLVIPYFGFMVKIGKP